VAHGLQRVDHQAQVVHAFAQHLHALLVRHAALLHRHQRRQQRGAQAVVHVGHDALALQQQRLLALGLAQLAFWACSTETCSSRSSCSWLFSALTCSTAPT
jgi:hypothetical protein